jgi:hypothetical protein
MSQHDSQIDDALLELCLALGELVNEIKNVPQSTLVHSAIPLNARRTALKIALPTAHRHVLPVLRET